MEGIRKVKKNKIEKYIVDFFEKKAEKIRKKVQFSQNVRFVRNPLCKKKNQRKAI